MTRHHLCLSGSGGQGLILGGALLAHAAVRNGKNVTMTSSYGPEARGGASRSNLIISDTPIDYPIPDKMDVVLAMNQEHTPSPYQTLQHPLYKTGHKGRCGRYCQCDRTGKHNSPY